MPGGLLTRGLGLGLGPVGLVIDGFSPYTAPTFLIPELYSVLVPDSDNFADVDPDLATLLN